MRLRGTPVTIGARILAWQALGSLPLAAVFLMRGEPWLIVIGLWAAGLLLAWAGMRLTVMVHVTKLMGAVEDWRRTGTFDPPGLARLPGDLRRLATRLKRSTIVLRRQERRLADAVQQQDLVMQEIHHRVKNNLQIVASLLNLQASRIRLPEARAEFQSARDRVRALATLHRHLYAHGELHTIDMREFLTELCSQLMHAFGEPPGGRLHLAIEAPELKMSSDQAVPLSLIVTEAVSNAVKYAFPDGRPGNISVRLTTQDGTAELVIRDDGVGIPAGRVQTEAGVRDGIGLQLIRGFARQLGAELRVVEDNGTEYRVTMPLRRSKIESPALGPAATRM